MSYGIGEIMDWIECPKCNKKSMVGNRNINPAIFNPNGITVIGHPDDPTKKYKCPHCEHEF